MGFLESDLYLLGECTVTAIFPAPFWQAARPQWTEETNNNQIGEREATEQVDEDFLARDIFIESDNDRGQESTGKYNGL